MEKCLVTKQEDFLLKAIKLLAKLFTKKKFVRQASIFSGNFFSALNNQKFLNTQIPSKFP